MMTVSMLSRIEANISRLSLREQLWLMERLAHRIRERMSGEQHLSDDKVSSVANPVKIEQALPNLERIVISDEEIMSGTPVFANTRVPIQSLIDHLQAGDSLEDFLTGFPSVTREQAEAFLELALQSALTEVVYARSA
jgi:uncharacterized protein (DUF433 family)